MFFGLHQGFFVLSLWFPFDGGHIKGWHSSQKGLVVWVLGVILLVSRTPQPFLFLYLQSLDAWFFAAQSCHFLILGHDAPYLQSPLTYIERTLWYTILQCMVLLVEFYFWLQLPRSVLSMLTLATWPWLQWKFQRAILVACQRIRQGVQDFGGCILAFAANRLLVGACRHCLHIVPPQSFYPLLRQWALCPDKRKLIQDFCKNIGYASLLVYADHKSQDTYALRVLYHLLKGTLENHRNTWMDSIAAFGEKTTNKSMLEEKEEFQELILQERWDEFCQITVLQRFFSFLIKHTKQSLQRYCLLHFFKCVSKIEVIFARFFTISTLNTLLPCQHSESLAILLTCFFLCMKCQKQPGWWVWIATLSVMAQELCLPSKCLSSLGWMCLLQVQELSGIILTKHQQSLLWKSICRFLVQDSLTHLLVIQSAFFLVFSTSIPQELLSVTLVFASGTTFLMFEMHSEVAMSRIVVMLWYWITSALSNFCIWHMLILIGIRKMIVALLPPEILDSTLDSTRANQQNPPLSLQQTLLQDKEILLEEDADMCVVSKQDITEGFPEIRNPIGKVLLDYFGH